MLKKALVAGGLMLGIAVAAVPAQATVVTTWNYTVNAGFENSVCEGGGTGCFTANLPGTFTNASSGDPTRLRWGDDIGNGLSGLTISDLGLASGSINTNDPDKITTTVTADNNTIDGNALARTNIHDVLQLQPALPTLGVQFALPALTFDIVYDETDNGGTCAAPSGSHPCADILAIANLTNAGFQTTSGGVVYISQALNNFDGENYIINLFITNLQLLTPDECNAVNTNINPDIPLAACYGFISQEDHTANFVASLQILDNGPVTNVPEPVTLSLFGAGLAGTAFARRRKAKKA